MWLGCPCVRVWWGFVPLNPRRPTVGGGGVVLLLYATSLLYATYCFSAGWWTWSLTGCKRLKRGGGLTAPFEVGPFPQSLIKTCSKQAVAVSAVYGAWQSWSLYGDPVVASPRFPNALVVFCRFCAFGVVQFFDFLITDRGKRQTDSLSVNHNANSFPGVKNSGPFLQSPRLRRP
jgi:hypothetical protein